MKLHEALKLKNDYEFSQVHFDDTIPNHYFEKKINGMVLIIENEEDNHNEWFGSIVNHNIKFYTYESFKSLIDAVKLGTWL